MSQGHQSLSFTTVQSTLVGSWQAILTLVLFFLSNVAVTFPLRVPIPMFVLETVRHALTALRIASEPEGHTPLKRRHLHLNFITVPLISVLILIASGAFNGQTLRDGILGTGGVQPLNIMALFISLAYISISLDATGLFRFLAFWVASKGGSSGRRLFTYLYLFFLLSGVVVGNDPVILSGTAFLAYFTRVAGINPPTAWIFSQFAAANMASVVLVSSNPTNLVLSGAFSLSFLSYAAHVVLPFAAAALAVFPLLLFVLFRARPFPFPSANAQSEREREEEGERGRERERERERELIPKRIEIGLSAVEVRATLVDARGAAFGSVLLVLTLGVLVGLSTVGVPVWEVTVPPALLMLARDAWHDRSTTGGAKQRATGGCADAGTGRSEHGVGVGVEGMAREQHELQDLARSLSSAPLKSSSPARPPLTLAAPFTKLAATFPTVTHVAERLPLPLLPFALLMSVLVQGLASTGWVELFARWWAAWVRATGVLGAVGGMGLLACVLCNFCGTNIGATILLARVLQLWSSSPALSLSSEGVDVLERDGALYALALGSNFGAFTLTFSASLAGLLWRQILRQKSIHVRGRQFLLLNLPISFVAMLVGCAVLIGQLYVEHGPR